MQLEIINCSNPTEAKPWEAAAATVHECAADRAERACHRIAAADRRIRGIRRQFVLATDVNEGRILDGDL